MLFFTPSAHLGLHRIFGTRMTRFFWNADAADDADFFVLFLNYPAERVLRDLRFICENLREKNTDDAVFLERGCRG
jgi:hypothetical protein